MTRLDALNATNHTMVSIHNQHGRFDACCPQPDHYWAFQTENNGKHQHLYQLTPGLPNTNSETPARIGGWDFHYPNNLTWNTDQPHHEILIPPPLNQLD